MQRNLTLVFVGDDGLCQQIETNKEIFVTKCREANASYFARMFEFKERTMTRINIHVPFAFAAKEIVMRIIDEKHPLKMRADRIVKRIHCANYLSMDFVDDFVNLSYAKTNANAYRLGRQFMDQKEYECKDFAQRLRKSAIKANTKDLFVIYNQRTVFVYDNKTGVCIKQIHFLTNPPIYNNGYALHVSINSVYPIIAVLSNSRLAVYDLSTGKIIKDFQKDLDGNTINSISFSPDGEYFYISYDKIIIYYSTSNWILVSSININKVAYSIKISYDNNLIAFVCNHKLISMEKVFVFSVEDGWCNRKMVANYGTFLDLDFTDRNILVFADYNTCNIVRYDYQEQVTIEQNIIDDVESFPAVLVHRNGDLLIQDANSDYVYYKYDIKYENYLKVTSFDALLCYFSFSGKYIYTITSDDKYSIITKYRCQDLEVISSCNIDIPTVIDLFNNVTNIEYKNHKLVANVDELLKKLKYDHDLSTLIR